MWPPGTPPRFTEVMGARRQGPGSAGQRAGRGGAGKHDAILRARSLHVDAGLLGAGTALRRAQRSTVCLGALGGAGHPDPVGRCRCPRLEQLQCWVTKTHQLPGCRFFSVLGYQDTPASRLPIFLESFLTVEEKGNLLVLEAGTASRARQKDGGDWR